MRSPSYCIVSMQVKASSLLPAPSRTKLDGTYRAGGALKEPDVALLHGAVQLLHERALRRVGLEREGDVRHRHRRLFPRRPGAGPLLPRGRLVSHACLWYGCGSGVGVRLCGV